MAEVATYPGSGVRETERGVKRIIMEVQNERGWEGEGRNKRENEGGRAGGG